MCLELLASVIKILGFSKMRDTPAVVSGKSQTDDLCNNPYWYKNREKESR